MFNMTQKTASSPQTESISHIYSWKLVFEWGLRC